jgi:hypothetical protein
MKYERPAVLATYRVAELKKEAAVCHRYGGGGFPGGGFPGGDSVHLRQPR